MRRNFSAPALTGSQLQQVFAGNTLGQHRWLSMYLQPDGTASGWHCYFKEIERSRCPQQDTDGDGLHLDADDCMQLTFANYQGAKDLAKGNRVSKPPER